MPNMSPKKAPMPSQDPNVRNKNFLEVATGYTEEVAIEEAQRCLNCKHRPCVNGCPVHIAIPDFIKEVAQGNFAGAYDVISQSSSLPAVCGRVCPQESQCESKCVRGIKTEPVGIGRLERFVADWHNAQTDVKVNKPESNGHKVAIVGSGPAGLTCAGDLAKKGYDLKIVEYTDYVQPNNVVDSGEIDANYFQHLPYLENFNKENGTKVVSVAAIHVEPMGLYGGKQSSLDAIEK